MTKEDELKLLEVLQKLADSVKMITESVDSLTQVAVILDGRITALEKEKP